MGKKNYPNNKTHLNSRTMEKQLFTEVLYNLEAQYKEDQRNKELIKEAFGFEDSVSVILNNSKLYKIILKLLEVYFPKDENGFSAIEHWCFYRNFGKPTHDSEYESPEQLYERLTKKD